LNIEDLWIAFGRFNLKNLKSSILNFKFGVNDANNKSVSEKGQRQKRQKAYL
jgi:hypothetical protein